MTNPDLRVKTLLLCHRVFFDYSEAAVHPFGITDVIGLNPQTRTNDRYEVLVEWEPPLTEPERIEYRITHEEDPDVLIYRAQSQFNPAPGHEPQAWMAFLLQSLPVGAWTAGHRYVLEVWTNDKRLATRIIKCLPIEDSHSS